MPSASAGAALPCAAWSALLLIGCAGADLNAHGDCDEAPRIAPCEGAHVQLPEAIGLWRWTSGSDQYNVAYDGCTVRFVDYLYSDPAVFTGWRNIAGAFVVDVHDYADPFPYFRARARWHGDALHDESILDRSSLIARWDGRRFRTPRGDAPMERVSSCAPMTASEARLVAATTVIPTESELAAQRGVEWPERRPVRDLMQEMLCPNAAECAP